MTSTKKLKIWTIIFQGLILVGFGHGILLFVVIEILWFPYLTKEPFSFDLDSTFKSHLPIVGLLTLLGQIALTISIFAKNDRVKYMLHLSGLALFWSSILYFTYGIDKENYVHFAALTCLPFLICTIITFAGQTIKKLYSWGRDNY